MTITQIKRLLHDNNLRANKRLGQNFIIDKNVVDKIIKYAGISASDTVLEIGAGLGNITTDLADLAKKVYAIEFDKGLYKILRERLGGRGNCELIHGDILKFDFKRYPDAAAKLKVIGNLPYYITTPVLACIIDNRDYIRDALFMVQKELGERLLASPGSRLYGSISCYIKFYAQLERKAVVKRTSFFPQPDVDSVLLHMRMLDTPSVAVRDEGRLFKIIRTAFNQRRKTLLSSLSNKNALELDKVQIERILASAGIASNRRPESLALEEFGRIANEC